MLRSFYYLNEPSLNEYVSAMEDGLRERRTESQSGTSSKEGSLDLRAVRGARGSTQEDGVVVESADDAPARFDRLMRLVKSDQEASGWVHTTVLDDVADLGLGALVEIECELTMPDLVKLFASGGTDELGQLTELMTSMAAVADVLGEDVAGDKVRPVEWWGLRYGEAA